MGWVDPVLMTTLAHATGDCPTKTSGRLVWERLGSASWDGRALKLWSTRKYLDRDLLSFVCAYAKGAFFLFLRTSKQAAPPSLQKQQWRIYIRTPVKAPAPAASLWGIFLRLCCISGEYNWQLQKVTVQRYSQWGRSEGEAAPAVLLFTMQFLQEKKCWSFRFYMSLAGHLPLLIPFNKALAISAVSRFFQALTDRKPPTDYLPQLSFW